VIGRTRLDQQRISRRRFGSMAAGLALSTVLGDVRARRARARPLAEGIEQIEHIVVLMQENRSFDNYLGRLHFEAQPDSEPLPDNAANPNPLNPPGPPISAFHSGQLCDVADLDHSWNGTHRAWNGGQMDGFTTVNQDPLDPNGSRAMSYFTSDELPFYYRLYSTFAMGDRYFSSVMGPTFPNRYFLLAGTSFGHVRNTIPDISADRDAYAPPNGTIFEQLDNAGVSWKVYFSQIPFAAIFGYVRRHWRNLAPMGAFYLDASLGRLPQVAFVDPIFLGGAVVEDDEHPPSNVQLGQRFVSDVITALFASPLWGSTALFLAYDEHGGYFDHVPPPPAVLPDNISPMLDPGDVSGAFDRYGIRVPVAVISPFSRPHFVSHVVNDHTSILKFIATRFNLPPLTERVAQANSMLEFFDFQQAAFMNPPQLPLAGIDPAGYVDCLQQNQDTLQLASNDGFMGLLQQVWGR
jgi:phospholipase C